MNIKDILQRDPTTPLINQGQARIADQTDEKILAELKGELSSFVCEGQFADGIERILSSFLGNLGQTSQKGAWVSGFYGSGKSHFLKMLAHLWMDTEFPDGSTARSLVPYMPEELRSLLRELDTAGKRAGGLLAAAGSVPSGTTDMVRLTILGIILRAAGLPALYPQAQFCLWLHDQGYFDRVKGTLESAGRSWEKELNDLYVSGPLARAVLVCDPHFASSEAEARKTIREQFPTRANDLTTEEFVTTAKRALRLAGRAGRMPCTVLVLDEVQVYIGDSHDRSTLVCEVAEAVSKQLDSQVILVASGQSALTEVRLLHKLLDRFTIRVPLSDTDVETVTRKVLLQKKPAMMAPIARELDLRGGEISRQLQDTRIRESTQDSEILVDDYPLLPVRRRFWEHCFRAIDAAGTKSQLRSQLQIIRDALANLADRPVGVLVPGDELYEALAPSMVETGVLLREINERIIHLAKDGSTEGRLARRICALAFLIGKLPRDAGADIGVRATKEHIADLLVDDLGADNGKVRSDVEATLEKLVADGVLMRVGDEHRLQTKEGAEWDREFRNRQTRLANDDADVQIRRDGLLYAEADRMVRGLRILHGAAKEARQLVIHRDQTPPQNTGEAIPVWIRDGWSTSEREFVEAARSAGSDSPVIFVFVPRRSADDLRRYVIEAAAAQATLDAKGIPEAAEGKEARRSMESRRDEAVRKRDELVREIVAKAKVFQGGGNELLQAALEERLEVAAKASVVRLFPRFPEADSAAWEVAIKRAREGADQPLQPVGWSGSTEQHPVCQQVLGTIGAGKTGGEVRKALQAAPFGWPRDAVDAALIALHRSQAVTATLNGMPVALGQLDQNKIQKAEFRIERAALSVGDRLAIRKLYTVLGISCKSGEELGKAAEFLTGLVSLAEAAGGPAPLPPRPSIAEIESLQKLPGNEQLAAIRNKATEWEAWIAEWKKAKELAEQRKPVWATAERLANHAAGLPAAADAIAQLEAVQKERMLLAATDPVTPIRAALAEALRQAVNEAHAAHEQAYSAAMAELQANETWVRLAAPDQAEILAQVGLAAPVKGAVSSDEALLATLDARPLPARQAEADAVRGRLARALEMAAKLLEPKVRTIRLERATLCSEGEVRQWLARQEKLLLEAVEQGPVLVS
jgi:hypothetical protein